MVLGRLYSSPCLSSHVILCITFLQRLIPYLGAPFLVAEAEKEGLVGIPVLCTSGELLNSSLEFLLGLHSCYLNEVSDPWLRSPAQELLKALLSQTCSIAASACWAASTGDH